MQHIYDQQIKMSDDPFMLDPFMPVVLHSAIITYTITGAIQSLTHIPVLLWWLCVYVLYVLYVCIVFVCANAGIHTYAY